MTAISSDQIAVQPLERGSGFVVGAGAYETFRDQSHLKVRLHELLDGLDVDDPDNLQATAAQASSAVLGTPMPGWLAESIASAYLELISPDTDSAVTVQVSDAPEDSFTVCGAIAVVEAVRRCWSSRFSARSLYRRALDELELPELTTAVVVRAF